jgi:hypothetical protein
MDGGVRQPVDAGVGWQHRVGRHGSPMHALVTRLALLALPLLGASAGAVGGCGDRICTLSGCVGGLELVFDETIPRDYTVTITTGDRVVTADCTAAVDPDTTHRVVVALSDDSSLVTCGTDHLLLGVTPPELTVRLEYADGTVTQVELRPDYEESYPNGEECDDVPCLDASIPIDVNAPVGT